MKATFVLSVLAALALVLIPAKPVFAQDESEVVVGTLKYIARPDISICFCGSYRVATEAGYEDRYLTSESLDLSQYVGARIMVYGKPYSAICSGTLARSCSYLSVEKIVWLTSSTGVAAVDWSTLKMIYR
jgi:hypothetical protein